MQRHGLKSTYLSICNEPNKVLKLRCGYSQLIFNQMDNSEIKFYIEKRKKERKKIVSAWNEIESINKESAFSMDCFRELQARISSKLAFIDRSIQDHKRLL